MFRWYFKVPQHFLDLLKECRGGESDLTTDDITPFDLESAMAIRIRRNDVSFITKDNRLIIFIEHQSTLCPNMAFRLFLYYVELLQLWIKTNTINLYGKEKLSHLPVPEFYVVYNGAAPLADSYSTFNLDYPGIKIDIEVKILDIHFHKLKETENTNALAGYSFFYKVFDESIIKGKSRQDAFDTARDECIKHGYMPGFIRKEDLIMFYKDFLDYDTQLKAEAREEGREEGKAEGREEGREEGRAESRAEGEAKLLNAAIRLLNRGIDLQIITETLQLSDSHLTQIKNAMAS